MLERVEHRNEVVTYQSPLLRDIGVTHGFSTRIGGLSAGPFATLNLGNPGTGGQQDSAGNISDNFRLLREALGCAKDVHLAWVTQVHGRRVELIEREPENEYAETLAAEIRDRFSGQLSADGIVCVVPQVLATIRVADCVPVLLSSEDGKVVGAVHAGWRGVVGNVVAKAVRTMHEAAGDAAEPAKIRAAIGPAISAEHFEVGDEVAAEFVAQGLADAVDRTRRPRPHLDLQRAIHAQLRQAGVTLIEGNDRCTYRDAAEFFSHRRDNGVTGRMVAAICAR